VTFVEEQSENHECMMMRVKTVTGFVRDGVNQIERLRFVHIRYVALRYTTAQRYATHPLRRCLRNDSSRSWLQRQSDAHQKNPSVIRNKEDVNYGCKLFLFYRNRFDIGLTRPVFRIHIGLNIFM